jgi:beta-aspartyl-dipeptidase (metallo-type)
MSSRIPAAAAARVASAIVRRKSNAADFIAAGVTSPVAALGTDSLGRSLDVLYGNVMGLRSRRSACLHVQRRLPRAGADAHRRRRPRPVPRGPGDRRRRRWRSATIAARSRRYSRAASPGRGHAARRDSRRCRRHGTGACRRRQGAPPALLREVVDGCDLPSGVLFPTHVNRSTALLDEAADWAVRAAMSISPCPPHRN